MAHPDRQPASPVIEGHHIGDHIRYELPVFFSRTNKTDREGVILYRHYEDGTMTVVISGEAIHELERRDRRGPIGR